MEVIIISGIFLVLFIGIMGVIMQSNYKRKPNVINKDVGSVGICSKKLYHSPNGTRHEFYVTYEVEVIATSEHQLKVKVLDYSSTYSAASKSENKDWITKIVDNGWIYKSEFDLASISNTQDKRDKKLNDLLN